MSTPLLHSALLSFYSKMKASQFLPIPEEPRRALEGRKIGRGGETVYGRTLCSIISLEKNEGEGEKKGGGGKWEES